MIALLPVADVIDVDHNRESPDCNLVFRGGRRVGVEVVRALDGVEASGAGTRARLRKKILDGLNGRGVPAFVGLSFPTSLAGAMNTRPDLVESNAANIVKLACDAIPPTPGESVEFGTRFADDPGSLESRGIHWIEHVSIARAQRGEAMVMINGQGNMKDYNLVQSAIDAKAKLLPRYRTDVDEHWLLVVGVVDSGLFVDDVEDRTFLSPFFRTIFLELFEKRCVELTTTAHAECATTIASTAG